MVIQRNSLSGDDNIYIYIYAPFLRVLSNLAKELMITTRVKQSTTNESSISVSDSVKCKQKEINIYWLKSLACVGFAAVGRLCYQADVNLIGLLSQVEASSLFNHPDALTQRNSLSVYDYIYTYVYTRIIK